MLQVLSDRISNNIDERRIYLEKVIKYCDKTIKKYPEGHIRIIENHGKDQYYIKLKKGDRIGSYIKRQDEIKAKEIAQKDYLIAVKTSAEKEIQAINRFEKSYNFTKCEAVYQKCSKKRQLLLDPITLTDEEYVKRWENFEYEGKLIETETDFITDKGEKVRSKSEIIIANTLFKMGIPYRYECPIELRGYHKGIAYPDFTVLNVRRRKEMIWEHFGMMDNERYLDDAMYRIEMYEENGYKLGEDFIMSFETSEHPLGISAINRKIERYLY
ncbi:MAG: hypothetical protein K6A23_14245 [Butyrivibrio sp.]|nr:hypothetical protein [Butyrivibrio sp.]